MTKTWSIAANIFLEVMAGEESDALELLDTLSHREREEVARAAEHLAALARRSTCTCYPSGWTYETYEGPQPWCDVHGQPSVVYDLGIRNGQEAARWSHDTP